MPLFSDPNAPGYARVTGALYLIIAVAGAFSILYVPSQLFVAGDAAQTVGNIVARRGLFDLGVAGDVVVMLAELMATVMLFFMFRAVSPTLSAVAALARLSMVAVMSAMLLFHAGTVALADPGPALLGLPDATRLALAALMIQIHNAGVLIWQVFFTLHLAMLGWLVARSGVYPALLGRAMTLGAFGYLLNSVHLFAFPDATLLGYVTAALLVVVTFAEIGFALWLLLRGPRPASAPTTPVFA